VATIKKAKANPACVNPAASVVGGAGSTLTNTLTNVAITAGTTMASVVVANEVFPPKQTCTDGRLVSAC
jgi:hypothetical protein